MSLDLYEKYVARVSLDACTGDALGANPPREMEKQLQELETIANEGAVDGWMDYLNPKHTFEENKSVIKEVAGANNNGCVTCSVNHGHSHDHEDEHPQESPNIIYK